MDNLLEAKTYKQPSGMVVQLRRFDTGCERLVDWKTQESTGYLYSSGDYIINPEMARRKMAEWQVFEEKIGSELL